MSTPGNPIPASPPEEREREIKIVSHSDLFYWWPVWAIGFLMALLSFWDGHQMAIVPDGTVAASDRIVEGVAGPRDVLIVPEGRHLPAGPGKSGPTQPDVSMARSNSLGGVFITVLLVVIVISNVHLRGVWSAVAILVVLFAAVLFALLDWWDSILRFASFMDIHINGYGYLCFSTALLIIWLVVFFFFDRLKYVSFRRGQFRVHLAVGLGETAFEVNGMVINKKRDDLVRHWIIGFGSGDLVVRTGGVNAQTFELPNVIFIGKKLVEAQQMLQEREVVKGMRP